MKPLCRGSISRPLNRDRGLDVYQHSAAPRTVVCASRSMTRVRCHVFPVTDQKGHQIVCKGMDWSPGSQIRWGRPNDLPNSIKVF
jgi:hypothetical protein